MAAKTNETLVIRAYAQALFNVGRAQAAIPRLMSEALQTGELLARRPSLRHFLEGPQIPTERKRQLVDRLFKGRLHLLLLNLFYLMVDRERAIFLPAILRTFIEIAEEAEGLHPASVTSARALNADEQSELRRALERHTGQRLKVAYRVDPRLIGGIVFRFRDVLIDGSVRHGLDELRKRFLRRDGAAAT